MKNTNVLAKQINMGHGGHQKCLPSRTENFFLIFSIVKSLLATRMHSSRMRTGHSLTVCRGVSAPEWGSCPGGLSGPGGCLLWGDGGIAACTEADTFPPTPPLVDRITDTSKNITLATTSLRPVIIAKQV